MKLQDYSSVLQHILEKTNTKTDILSRKDQVDTIDDNKNIKLLKSELWTRQVKMEVELIIIRKSQMVEEIILLDKIQKYQIKKQKVQKELETNNGQA